MSDEIRLALCACPPSTPATGRAIVWDPDTKTWNLILWEPKPGINPVMGHAPVGGCPVCLTPASFENSASLARVPQPAVDHLKQLKERREAQVAAFGNYAVEDHPADSPRVDFSVYAPPAPEEC